jgi:GWxTD domain-containing protein
MNNKLIWILCVATIIALPAVAPAQAPLSPKHKTWIEEEVPYIITTKERDVFYKLETDRDRDLLIEEFWRQRDPTPGTPRNEFRDEHYRRIEFANKTFGRGTPFKGWRTDQGRIYIMLGMPIDIQRITTSDTYPMEIWQYRGNPALGQAPFFQLLFFQKGGMGKFKLYKPLSDGPKALVPDPFRQPQISNALGMPPAHGLPSNWDAMDIQAFKLLEGTLGSNIAQATYSFFPGVADPNSLRSQILLAEIDSYPKKKVNDAYAYDFLEHKASVEVSYSVHFMGNRSAVSVLKDPAGLFFLSYVIVPDSLTLDAYQDKYLADLKTTLRLSDAGGKTLFQQEKFIPIELRKEELKAVQRNSFQFYDAVPIIPGNYTFNLLLENTVSKEFTSIEKTISIPEGDPLWMSPLVLARRVAKNLPTGGASRAYQVGTIQIYPCINSTFQAKDSLFLFFQIHGLNAELKDSGILAFSIVKDGQTLQPSRKNVRDYGGGRDFLEEFSTEKLIPGTYAAKTSLLDKLGREVLSQKADFLISDKAIPGTWVAAQANPPADDPYYAFVLGSQYLNKGDIDTAQAELFKAYSKKPDSLEYALSYAQVLLVRKEPAQARDILLPFAKKDIANFDLYESLGKAYQETGEFKDAAAWYQKALAFKGNVIEILNSLGECYFKMGDKGQALRAWKKSLEINPKQENIKKMIDKLRE